MHGLLKVIIVAVVSVILAIGWNRYKVISPPPLPPVIEGFFLPEYRPVAELFRRQVEDGTERGGSLAVYQRGQPLVELWAGYADPESRRPWRGDTLTMTWGCTKGATALVVTTLVDKGLLDYKAKIHQYWPEFEANGKANITVEMLLVHQAGLLSLGNHSISLLQYKHEWEKVEQFMASAAPDYPPGSRQVYHVLTFAMYVDALVRRVDPKRRNLTRYFDEEIAKPFGIDFYIGLPLELYYRAARQYFPSRLGLLARSFSPLYILGRWKRSRESDRLVLKAQEGISFMDPEAIMLEILNDPLQMEVGLGSLMGFGSASSLAKMYDILANQGAAGSKVLLSKLLVESLRVPVTALLSDPSQKVEDWFSHGFEVTRNVLGDVMFGHQGSSGQRANADPTNGLGIAYVTNFFQADQLNPTGRYLELERVFYECFQAHRAKKAS